MLFVLFFKPVWMKQRISFVRDCVQFWADSSCGNTHVTKQKPLHVGVHTHFIRFDWREESLANILEFSKVFAHSTPVRFSLRHGAVATHEGIGKTTRHCCLRCWNVQRIVSLELSSPLLQQLIPDKLFLFQSNWRKKVFWIVQWHLTNKKQYLKALEKQSYSFLTLTTLLIPLVQPIVTLRNSVAGQFKWNTLMPITWKHIPRAVCKMSKDQWWMFIYRNGHCSDTTHTHT